MKSKYVVAVLLSFSALQVQALEIDSCPLPQNIKNTKGVYSAITSSREGQWVGTTSAVRGSADDSFSAEPVKSFQGAVFYTSEKHGVARGVLSRCMYSNRAGESLDLYYRADVRPDLAVKLLDLKKWVLQPESQTGLKTYVCHSKAQGGCVFALVD